MQAVVDNQKAILLHSRVYTDSKILIELLTPEFGRVSGVFRVGKRSRPQPFKQLNVSWKGRAELKTITLLENFGEHYGLSSFALYCGLYLNELLMRLLPRDDEQHKLFDSYSNTLMALANEKGELRSCEKYLRAFELDLLESIGYGLDFNYEENGNHIVANEQRYYNYAPSKGFTSCFSEREILSGSSFSGAFLEAIGKRNFYSRDVERAAKKLCRIALAEHLGNKPLKTRELFR